MSNLAEEQRYLEWHIYNLHKASFKGRHNRGNKRALQKAYDDLAKIKGILYPKRKRY